MLDRQNTIPLYKQIYSILFEEINNGVYTAAGKLPSEKELTQRFDVERNTVRNALQLLVEKGMVVKAPGYGTKLIGENKLKTETIANGNIKRNVLFFTQEDYLQGDNGEYFHLRLIGHFERILSNKNFNLVFKLVNEEVNFNETIQNSDPAALIFDSYNPEILYQKAKKTGIPCVSVNHYTPYITSRVSNNFDGAYKITDILTAAGHNRIAVVTGKENYQTNIERLSGVHGLYIKKKIRLDPKYIISGRWSFNSGYEAGEKILSFPKAERPTAVFAFNDDMAYGCLSCFEKHGISVPDEISLAGFDKSERYSSVFRPITTIDVNINAIVNYMCWYIFGRIDNTAPETCAKIQIDTIVKDEGTIKNIN